MPTFTETVVETYHVVSCYTCGAGFGVSNDLYRRAVLDKKGTLYCPACGKSTRWVGETRDAKKARIAEERLARAEARANDRLKRLEAERRRHAATKGQLTKTKNRIAGGACPCCNRTFVDLARHMATKHADYTTDTPDRG